MASRFHTGGLGVMHGDGCIELKDRAKDIIISGGENISTIEVEGVLYKHPAVLEAAVVARLDEKWGETPCAFLTLKAGKSATEGEIIAFCRDNLAHYSGNIAHYKCLRPVIYCDLPKTSTCPRHRPARCGGRQGAETGKAQKFVLPETARNP